MHRMEGGAYANATQYDTEGAQGTILYSQFASPESQWVVTETGVNSNDKFPLIALVRGFAELQLRCFGQIDVVRY